MIVQSKLECVHQYGEVNLVPGVNMIPDNVGRELVKHRGWKELFDPKHPAVYGKVKVIVAPAAETKKGAASDKGEAATANMSPADAIKWINKSEIVDQITTVMLLETRPAVQNACQARIEALAKQARQEGEDDEKTNLVEGAQPPEHQDDELV